MYKKLMKLKRKLEFVANKVYLLVAFSYDFYHLLILCTGNIFDFHICLAANITILINNTVHIDFSASHTLISSQCVN